MDLSDIVNLGAIGTNLFANAKVKTLSKRQQVAYYREAELNRRIGALNSEAAERTGLLAVQTIQEHTKRVMNAQVNIFRNRGIELEGSPMLVLGETVTTGEKQAKEAMFNAMVKQYNYQLSAETAAQHAMNNAERTQMKAMQSNLNMLGGVYKGLTAINSMAALGKFDGGGLLNSVMGGVSSVTSSIGKIFSGLLS